ncbi:MAG: hypothetical protein V1801_02625 [Candidatus Falkowbacteria bacterium]
MFKKCFKIIFLFLPVAIIILPQLVLAADNAALKKLQTVGSTEGPFVDIGSEWAISQIIGVVIQAALALVGTIFLVLMIHAGYNWMTARGDEEKVTKAKDTITRAIIGLIIVVGAYAIQAFVISNIL